MIYFPYICIMEKNILNKANCLQKILEGITREINELTIDNINSNLPNIISITKNLNITYTQNIIDNCGNDNAELELIILLEKLSTNINAITSLLMQVNETNLQNAKQHLIQWIQFYADALKNKLAIFN